MVITGGSGLSSGTEVATRTREQSSSTCHGHTLDADDLRTSIHPSAPALRRAAQRFAAHPLWSLVATPPCVNDTFSSFLSPLTGPCQASCSCRCPLQRSGTRASSRSRNADRRLPSVSVGDHRLCARSRQAAPIPDVVWIGILVGSFKRPPEMGVEAVSKVGFILRRPQGEAFGTSGGKPGARRLEEQPAASSSLVPRVHVQPHDVPDALRIVVGVLGGPELAEPDHLLILDQHQDATAQSSTQRGMTHPIAVSRSCDSLVGHRLWHVTDVRVLPCLRVDPRQRGGIRRCCIPYPHCGHSSII